MVIVGTAAATAATRLRVWMLHAVAEQTVLVQGERGLQQGHHMGAALPRRTPSAGNHPTPHSDEAEKTQGTPRQHHHTYSTVIKMPTLTGPVALLSARLA
eukprot:43084-Eustigmatos_ZCMA.PRE.1